MGINHPMPFITTQFLAQLQRQVQIDLFVAVFIIFALSFIPASFLVFLLEERETNAKQLQFVSGVKPYIYWISNLIWDLINYFVPVLLCVLIFLAFNVQTYTSKENLPCLVLLMLLYGWAVIPLMYPLNYLFQVPSTAFVVASSMNVFVGVVTTMTTTVLDQLADGDTDLLQINNVLKPLFIILFPHYGLGQGFIQMASLYNIAKANAILGRPHSYDPFLFNNVGRNMLAMTCQGVAYFILNLLIQYKFFVRIKPTQNVSKLKLPQNEQEDDDVLAEKKRILNNDRQGKQAKKNNAGLFHRGNKKLQNQVSVEEMLSKQADVAPVAANTADSKDYIRFVNLTKIFKKFKRFRFKRHVAVNDLSLGINKGECFGLIGVNGAGKTTTFKMLTGEIPASGGEVYVNGYKVSSQIENVHENIGYCPQSDAIIPLLTAREHLMFFGRLRGIPEKYVAKASEWAINRVGLNVYADRISGGMWTIKI